MAGVRVASMFLLIVAMSSACLITNCPRGGKRSFRPAPETTNEELPFCTLCGPTESGGICFGSAVCCSEDGCKVGGPNASACLGSQSFPPHCRIPQKTRLTESALRCGGGLCLPSGLCCTADWCRPDEHCLSASVASSEHNLQSTLRGSEQQPSFNEWHSRDNTESNEPQAYHI